MIVLNERVGYAQISELCAVVGLHEKAPSVADDLRAQLAHAGKRGFNSLHEVPLDLSQPAWAEACDLRSENQHQRRKVTGRTLGRIERRRRAKNRDFHNISHSMSGIRRPESFPPSRCSSCTTQQSGGVRPRA